MLGLYRERPGPLTGFQLGDALIFADTATLLLPGAQDQAGGDLAALGGPGGQPPDLALRRAEIDQATGMLTEQLGAGIGDPFVRLRAYAYARDLRLTDVARDIVARRLRLHPDLTPPGTVRREALARSPARTQPARAPATNPAAFPERVNRNGRTTAVGNVR